MSDKHLVWLHELNMNDVERVGGKNASLGELIGGLKSAGVNVPGGFATTAAAYREFLAHDGLAERISATLAKLDVDDVNALAETGATIRGWVHDHPFPPELESQIREAFASLAEKDGDIAVAVRSSATAEDLPDASFAGQQETFLNIRGIENVLAAIRDVFASLFNDRAIAYRVHHGFEHDRVALSAGIQHMVRADTGASGVMFTIDTESGFDQVVFITSAWGLGEAVVQGAVNPDEYYVYKPNVDAGRPAVLRRSQGDKATKMVYTRDTGHEQTTAFVDVDAAERARFSLTDADAEALAAQALAIERHYGRPMDIEWAKDGETGALHILQARPETVQSRPGAALQRYHLDSSNSDVLAEGRAIGQRVGSGPVRNLASIEEMNRVEPGDILVTGMTDPDWEPIMKRAAAVVTDRGGRTCHAAIIARELGIAAVVGTGDATQRLTEGTPVTVSCAEGDAGFVYDGELDFSVEDLSIETMPDIGTKLMVNVGNPDRAFDFASVPNAGVGLARLEFIINRQIGIHPRAALAYAEQPTETRQAIDAQISGYADPVSFYVERLAEGIATIASAFAPKPVIVRLSDFKSNEYANLIGGSTYEPDEENPMLGWRGASRYQADDFRACFELELAAVKRVRDDMGLSNVEIMIPFVRTLDEAEAVTQILADNGLERGRDGLRVIMMCELPTNALLADQFLDYFDGFSIGSNDLTQLTLGLDRDSGLVSHAFDERDPAVKALLEPAIAACKRRGKYVGICGQGPSDHPDLAHWLLERDIDSMSLNPDTVVSTWLYLAGDNTR
ncbi:phosphoenolpyruvate synthase [Salinisphaera sp. USBA-960]|nr:phosphoenolpyruvate synthase [Salifodinibacter halophilus]NNC25811.1 phosphoenolpyruvate synthase [Salifodinibacter halophilus]